MDAIIMVLCATVVLGVIVFVHEGGHYLAARAFGVRVTEFMLGLPGPSIGFRRGETRFGVTAVPLGGYAKVCGMESGDMSPHLPQVLAALYRRGTADMEDVARDCGITDEEALFALDELVEWGSAVGPTKRDEYNTYRAPAVRPTKRQQRAAAKSGKPPVETYEEGQPRVVENPQELFSNEYRQQYRSLPFWKRSVILVAGVGVNLLFAVLAFVVIYSVIGFDVQLSEGGPVQHVTVSPLQSVQMGFMVIGTTVQAVVGLFNPATAAETVSNSSSIVGIAVMSKDFFAAGAVDALFFIALISMSVGIMNLLPIPPLDGGRFVVEVFQKLARRTVTQRVMNGLSMAGMALFMLFFVFMLNQDVQRIITGYWS